MTPSDPTHRLFERLVPTFEPPEGRLPDAERVAALLEGRLPPGQSQALLDEIRRSPAARVELRSLDPERFQALMGEESVEQTSAKVLAFPARSGRRVAWVAVAAAALAAAAALVVWLPASPPAGAGVTLVSRAETVRRHGVAEPGDLFHLRMRLGTPGTLDRLRGRAPWGALVQADENGVRLVCTSDDTRCRSAADTLSWSFRAPLRAGVTGFAFLSAGEAPTDAELEAVLKAVAGTAPADLGRALQEPAAAHRWQVHPVDPVEVQ